MICWASRYNRHLCYQVPNNLSVCSSPARAGSAFPHEWSTLARPRLSGLPSYTPDEARGGLADLIKMYIASLRLAIALVCIGVSLILSAQWFGLIPDPIAMSLKARQATCEAVAINAAAHVRKQQWIDLESTLKTIESRDEDLLSIGLRSESGSVRIDTGHHQATWPAPGDDTKSVDTMSVPITLNRRPWGNVEFCFRRAQPTTAVAIFENATFRLVGYFILLGLVGYTFFVARVMGVFNRTQVVPNRVRQALDTLAEGLLVLDEKKTIVLANSAFAEAIGIDVNELGKLKVDDLPWVHDDTTATELPWVSAIDLGQTRTEVKLRYKIADGRERILSVNAAPLGADQQPGALATFRDITHIEEHRVELERMLRMLRSSRDEISRKNRELEILATQDALTGCLNRRAFFERFERHWNDAKSKRTPLACIMIDNDHFKSVNDNYGHHTGDEVLRAVSRVIREMHEERDLVCRYGGEEFCVVLPGRTSEQAADEADKIRIAISQIKFKEPAELRLTASLGVSEISLGAADPQGMINQADMCLYVAKRNGRNKVVTFDPSFEAIEVDESKVSRTKESPETPTSVPFQAVTALVSALAYRDVSTAEHSRRVADLCVRAAENLLDQRSTYLLEIAALLHDIGKIGVPDSVLLKPGPLTAQEWKLMGNHDRIGVEIVAGTFACPDLAEIIRTSHAYFAGRSTAPHLPTGTDIPLEARLLAIANSYDAMTNNRVYRRGRPHEKAIAELRRCAGTQFDPELVEHFASKISGSELAVTQSTVRVPKQVAVQIGLQIERLADAIDRQDTNGLKVLASRLGQMALHCNIRTIADSASRLEEQIKDDEEVQWLDLLRETQHLLDCCRATQNSFLTNSDVALSTSN